MHNSHSGPKGVELVNAVPLEYDQSQSPVAFTIGEGGNGFPVWLTMMLVLLAMAVVGYVAYMISIHRIIKRGREALKLSRTREVIGQVTSGAHQSLFCLRMPPGGYADVSILWVQGMLPFLRVSCIPSYRKWTHMARKLILSILVMAFVICLVLLIMRFVVGRLQVE